MLLKTRQSDNGLLTTSKWVSVRISDVVAAVLAVAVAAVGVGCSCDNPQLNCTACGSITGGGSSSGASGAPGPTGAGWKLNASGLTVGCVWNECMKYRFGCGVDPNHQNNYNDQTYCIVNLHYDDDVVKDFGLKPPANGYITDIVSFDDSPDGEWGKGWAGAEKKRVEKQTAKRNQWQGLGGCSIQDVENKVAGCQNDPGAPGPVKPAQPATKDALAATYADMVRSVLAVHNISPDDMGNPPSQGPSTLSVILLGPAAWIPIASGGPGTLPASQNYTGVWFKSAELYCVRVQQGLSDDALDGDHLDEDHSKNAVGTLPSPDYDLTLAQIVADQGDPACAAGPGSGKTGGPGGGTGSNSYGSAVGALANALDFMGHDAVDPNISSPKTSPPGGNKLGSGAATAGFLPNTHAPKDKGGGDGVSPPSAVSPKMVGVSTVGAGGAGGGGLGGGAGGTVSQDADTATGTLLTSAAGAYEGIAGGGRAGGGAGAAGGLFGGAGADALTAGAPGNVAFGQGSAADGTQGGSPIDLETYLANVGNLSLFVIVNKRMDKWGAQLEGERLQSGFRKFSQ